MKSTARQKAIWMALPMHPSTRSSATCFNKSYTQHNNMDDSELDAEARHDDRQSLISDRDTFKLCAETQRAEADHLREQLAEQTRQYGLMCTLRENANAERDALRAEVERLTKDQQSEIDAACKLVIKHWRNRVEKLMAELATLRAQSTDKNKLLHALASPTDMVARCGFTFTVDKPADLLNTDDLKEVCHECAVLAYAAAENRASEAAEKLARSEDALRGRCNRVMELEAEIVKFTQSQDHGAGAALEVAREALATVTNSQLSAQGGGPTCNRDEESSSLPKSEPSAVASNPEGAATPPSVTEAAREIVDAVYRGFMTDEEREKFVESILARLRASDAEELRRLTSERDEWRCSALLYHSELRDLAEGKKVETQLGYPVEKLIEGLREELRRHKAARGVARDALKKVSPSNLWDKARMYYDHPDTGASIREWHRKLCDEYESALAAIDKELKP